MKKIVITCLKIFVIVLILIWMGVFVTDYFRARDEKEPLVCLSKDTKDTSKATYYECVSFGYKYFRYQDKETQETSYGFSAAFLKNEFEKKMEE